MNVNAILTAIEECARGDVGVTRTGVETLELGAYAHRDETVAARARTAPRVEVEIADIKRSMAVGPELASVLIMEVGLLVRLEYTTEHELQADQRLAVRAQAAEDVETVRRALSYPGNLSSTYSGTSTGIVSGCLSSWEAARVVREDWAKRIYRVEMRCRVLVRDAV